MRLERLNTGHSLGSKVMLRIGRLVLGADPYDVVKMLSYRPAFLGKRMNALCQSVMRGKASEWSVGERELFAAFVSRLNQCVF
jgi:hypothetical protein